MSMPIMLQEPRYITTWVLTKLLRDWYTLYLELKRDHWPRLYRLSLLFSPANIFRLKSILKQFVQSIN